MLTSAPAAEVREWAILPGASLPMVVVGVAFSEFALTLRAFTSRLALPFAGVGTCPLLTTALTTFALA